MDDTAAFGSGVYLAMLALLVFARGADFLSTWVATPNLVLEGNPLAKRMGWKYGIPFNAALCAGFAHWPAPAIVISTASALVAARNFQHAWLMRSLGEESYRLWHLERMRETRWSLYLLCLAGQTALTAGVGAALLYYGDPFLVPVAIGMGIIGYAVAVALYTLLAFWRLRRSMRPATQPI